MSLSKTYQPSDHEREIYQRWENAGAFQLENSKSNKKPFVVVLPPPNANANLHLGYVLDSQLKDILGRWQRLNGHPVLLLPGADHAGFETWAVYEKHLNSLGKSRFDFDREELYQQVYDFVIKNKLNMENQIRRFGISCDWQKFTFTLDKKVVDRSYQTFRQMWEEDLIYRGKRLVNYCTAHGTGFSDLEVTFKEVAGKLYFIKYPLVENPNSNITIATTRPETLLGDVAVAVHPADGRYSNLHGQSLKLPLTGREIPLIYDQRVISDFGSGALKITPAHDFLDFEIARTAGLQSIEILNKQGKVTEHAPPEFRELNVHEARKLVLQHLKEKGFLEKTEDYKHQVGHCYKCDTVLEPLLADQWFVRMQPLAKTAIKKLQEGTIKFYPANKREELITYLNQLQDWNISRQIAWGIPIPVFQNEADADDWIFDERVEQKMLEIDGKTYRRDPDVFDTWWSSGQWPFATVDWSEGSLLYPQALMETGVDILRPWVSRMIVLSLFVTGRVPFEVVYLHGMIIDEQGVKMSKSKGNVVDPMDVIETYGADALRISLCGRVTAGQPQRFSQAKITAGRNFCNKLWNIGRFIQGTCGDQQTGKLILKSNLALDSAADHWIYNKLLKTKQAVDRNLADYRLTAAWDAVSTFVWNDLADWYLEACKWQINKPLLSHLFAKTLRLVHPFVPFLSEALYQKLLADPRKPLLINSTWDDDDLLPADQIQQEKIEQFDQIRDLTSSIRQLLPLDARRQSQLIVKNDNSLDQGWEDFCLKLTGIKTIERTQTTRSDGLRVGRSPGLEAWILLKRELLEQQLFKLEAQMRATEASVINLNKRLTNQAYLENAPAHLIQETKERLSSSGPELETLKSEIKKFRQAL